LDRIAKSPRAFLDTLTDVTYDSRNTGELLSSLGVGPSPPLETFIEKLVEYVQERMRMRQAAKKEHEAEDPLA
jgi:hypothetical protein